MVSMKKSGILRLLVSMINSLTQILVLVILNYGLAATGGLKCRVIQGYGV